MERFANASKQWPGKSKLSSSRPRWRWNRLRKKRRRGRSSSSRSGKKPRRRRRLWRKVLLLIRGRPGPKSMALEVRCPLERGSSSETTKWWGLTASRLWSRENRATSSRRKALRCDFFLYTLISLNCIIILPFLEADSSESRWHYTSHQRSWILICSEEKVVISALIRHSRQQFCMTYLLVLLMLHVKQLLFQHFDLSLTLHIFHLQLVDLLLQLLLLLLDLINPLLILLLKRLMCLLQRLLRIIPRLHQRLLNLPLLCQQLLQSFINQRHYHVRVLAVHLIYYNLGLSLIQRLDRWVARHHHIQQSRGHLPRRLIIKLATCHAAFLHFSCACWSVLLHFIPVAVSPWRSSPSVSAHHSRSFPGHATAPFWSFKTAGSEWLDPVLTTASIDSTSVWTPTNPAASHWSPSPLITRSFAGPLPYFKYSYLSTHLTLYTSWHFFISALKSSWSSSLKLPSPSHAVPQ